VHLISLCLELRGNSGMMRHCQIVGINRTAGQKVKKKDNNTPGSSERIEFIMH
jgi:hypothetical protein